MNVWSASSQRSSFRYSIASPYQARGSSTLGGRLLEKREAFALGHRAAYLFTSGALNRKHAAMSERLVTMLIRRGDRRARQGARRPDHARTTRTDNLVLVVRPQGQLRLRRRPLRARSTCRSAIEFLGVRSYGEGTESSGVVQITQDLSRPIEGEDVLIVEDIVDTGLTIAHLLDLFRTRQPASVKVCALLHKPARARVEVKIDYLGFTIEDRFVVGYGLDFAERYRNLPYIGVVERS